MVSNIVEYIDNRFYSRSGSNWDDELFRSAILENIDASSIVLDIGAGAGIVKSMNFRGIAKKVCGIDLDERVIENPYLDEGHIGRGENVPYSDDEFDVVFSDNVLEHLAEPAKVFAEIRRVLKPGGVFLFKTPNSRHYMPLIARCTPQSFHRFINKRRGREEVDTFPTLYRANSVRTIQRLAQETGLEVRRVDVVEGRPEYTRIAWPIYLLGLVYERLVNSSEVMSNWRILLVGVLGKPVAKSHTISGRIGRC